MITKSAPVNAPPSSSSVLNAVTYDPIFQICAHSLPYFDRGVAVTEVLRHACGIGDVVERELRHELVHFQQQCQRLTDPARRTQDGNFGALDAERGSGTRRSRGQWRRRGSELVRAGEERLGYNAGATDGGMPRLVRDALGAEGIGARQGRREQRHGDRQK